MDIYIAIFKKYKIAPELYFDLVQDIEDNLFDVVAATPYDAASEIARDDAKWGSWSSSVHSRTNRVRTFVSAIPSVTAELEMVASAVRYPSKLRNLSEFRQGVPSLGKYNMFLDGIAEWVKSSDGSCWDDTLNPDVLHLYSAWCITLEALQAGACERAYFIFWWVYGRVSPYYVVDLLLPVVLDSPHPLRKALTDVYFGVALPKDVSLKITNAVFANNAMVYQKGLKFMYIGGITTVLGTFFVECQRDSTASTTSRQTVYCGCAMQALRQILRLPVRPLYGAVFENGVLRLVAVTVDATDYSYVLQESDAHSWDLRDPPALVECFYFLLALKKTVDSNLQKDFDGLRKRDDAALIDWDALRKRVEDWNEYDRERTMTAKLRRLEAARLDNPTDVDHSSDDYETDSEESSGGDEESDRKAREAKYVSILNWRHGREYPVRDLDAWYRDPDSMKIAFDP